jgi:hypothetical protein
VCREEKKSKEKHFLELKKEVKNGLLTKSWMVCRAVLLMPACLITETTKTERRKKQRETFLELKKSLEVLVIFPERVFKNSVFSVGVMRD